MSEGEQTPPENPAAAPAPAPQPEVSPPPVHEGVLQSIEHVVEAVVQAVEHVEAPLPAPEVEPAAPVPAVDDPYHPRWKWVAAAASAFRRGQPHRKVTKIVLHVTDGHGFAENTAAMFATQGQRTSATLSSAKTRR